jgi:hypothetical protein
MQLSMTGAIGDGEFFKELINAFPSSLPNVLSDQNWGDYGEVRGQIAQMQGSQWDKEVIIRYRSVLHFVNTDTYLYLIPKFISASHNNYIEWDILEQIINSFESFKRQGTSPFHIRHIKLLIKWLDQLCLISEIANQKPFVDRIRAISSWFLELGER